MKLEELGYTSFFETDLSQFGLAGVSVARVTSESKGAYQVKNIDGEYLAKITGKQIFNASSREDYPAVGDFVAVRVLDNDHAVIDGVLPRATVMKRKFGDRNKRGEKNETQIIAANIDVAFIVESIGRDYNLNRFERYIAIAENGGVKPVVVLNKVDLISGEELDEKLTQIKKRIPDVPIIPTTIVGSTGLDDLKRFIEKGKTYCFLGSSGVGKSSLINKLLGESAIKTGAVSSYSDRGKHITTSRQIYFLKNGGIVIDNPGVREVGMTDAGNGINGFFDEIAGIAQYCRFADCTHTGEPGCEVRVAVNTGEIDEEKYSNYTNLKKESEYFEMSDMEKKEKKRQFGKFINKAKKDLKKFGHKDY